MPVEINEYEDLPDWLNAQQVREGTVLRGRGRKTAPPTVPRPQPPSSQDPNEPEQVD
jgi:hypothetical protein